ncbi:hypothetical protein pdam_00002510 [Pocillopora damicornis]|uniref:Uncharacterized protein n=1 Tax=Pocillopora damicornis TaxID=46731 RepID=A0A3M6TRX5_POCDA|nr:hypothetical protein pdam_00002510 [Pocillopora damicornis]
MNTKFSWILVALLLSSFVCWSSTFAPGQHNPKMRYGKRHFVPQSNRANFPYLFALQEYLPRAWLKKSVEDTAKKQFKARLE